MYSRPGSTRSATLPWPIRHHRGEVQRQAAQMRVSARLVNHESIEADPHGVRQDAPDASVDDHLTDIYGTFGP